MDDKKQIKKQMEAALAPLDGLVLRFYADADCRQQVAVGILPTPAFNIDDNSTPWLAGYEPHSKAAKPGRAAFAKLSGGRIPVEQKPADGQAQPGVIYVVDPEVSVGGNIEIAGYALAVNSGTPAAPGMAQKTIGRVNVIKKADKDAAFAAAREALPDIVSDEAIREYTEHGNPVDEQAAAALMDAAAIPDAEPDTDPWIDPEAAEEMGAK